MMLQCPPSKRKPLSEVNQDSKVILRVLHSTLSCHLNWYNGCTQYRGRCRGIKGEGTVHTLIVHAQTYEHAHFLHLLKGIIMAISHTRAELWLFLPFARRTTVSKMVKQMMRNEVVEESSSPMVLMKKRDGSLIFCVDYRQLNVVTRNYFFPLPRIDDLLDQLSGQKVFSTLEAQEGYWQIWVRAVKRRLHL